MKSATPTRRELLAAAGLASLAGAVPAAAMLAGDGSATPSATPAADDAALPEYLLAPGLVYLNTASLGLTSRAVLERTLAAWRELESNPVQMAYGDGAVHLATDRVRELLANFLGCATDELLLTRSTTEAMNSLALGMRLAGGDRVLTSDQEHDGGSLCWRYLARRQGIAIDVVAIAPTDHDPELLVRRFAAAITPATRVLSISHVITTTGLRMPIVELAALARRHGILCVVDGAQAVGGIAVDVKALGCHAYAASGHKWLLGPKGTGLLYVSRDAGAAIEPIQREGGHRFVSAASGIGSLPLVVGLGAAVEAMNARSMAAVESHARALRNRAYAELARLDRITLASPPPGPLATGIVAFALPAEIDSQKLRDTLRDRHGIVVKMVEKRWFNGLRLSPHVFNTVADIDAVLGALQQELAAST
jgi:selenocysteine lyase/cysteine desulfurase